MTKNILKLMTVLITAYMLSFSNLAIAKNNIPVEVLNPNYWAEKRFEGKDRDKLCRGAIRNCSLEMLSASKGKYPMATSVQGLKKLNPLIEHYPFKDKTIVLITFKVNEDDSISGMRYRLVLQNNMSNYRLLTLKEQYRCARGETEDKWGKNLCP